MNSMLPIQAYQCKGVVVLCVGIVSMYASAEVSQP